MTVPAVILDTNIVLGGLMGMTGAVAGAGAAGANAALVRIVQGMLDAAFVFVVSDALLAEYANVLCRPHLSARHGLLPAQVQPWLAGLAGHATRLADGAGLQPVPQAPDPGDQFLWNLLAQGPGLQLVTLDKRLLRDRAMRGRVLTPDAYVAGAAAAGAAWSL